MKKPEKPEILQGDRALRLNLLILCGLYILMGLSFSPLIDWSLSQSNMDATAIAELAKQKKFFATLVFGIWRTIPVLFFLYFSFRIVASAKMPPGGMKRFPFTVPIMKGRQASMFGLLLMAASVMLLFRELLQLVRNAM